MEEIFLNLANKLAERIETILEVRIYPKFESFFRGNVRLCFSEEEAAAQLGIEKTTLQAIRRAGGINFYQTGKFATYGIHHLQDYLARHEVKTIPQIYSVKREISVLGVQTEARPRRVG